MPSPSAVFGFILATIMGAAFHLVFGGDVRRLALFLLAGWVGFSLGHTLGVLFQLNLLMIGPLRIIPAVIGALATLLLITILSANRSRKRTAR